LYGIVTVISKMEENIELIYLYISQWRAAPAYSRRTPLKILENYYGQAVPQEPTLEKYP
jgi:hypothetical protein